MPPKKGKTLHTPIKRELILKEDGQDYAQVIRMLGDGRLEAKCFDGKAIICHIRGKMRKRAWVNPGDIILISARDFQPNKADVILVYTTEEVSKLRSRGELPNALTIDIACEEEGFDFETV